MNELFDQNTNLEPDASKQHEKNTQKGFNKMIVYILLFVTVLIGTSSFLYFYKFKNKNTITQQNANRQIHTTNSTNQKVNQKNSAQNNPVSESNKISTIFGRFGDKLSDQSVSQSQMLNFAFQLGKEKADINLCNNFRSFDHNFLGACYAGIALSSNDFSICKKAPPQDGISECHSILAYVKKDVDLCNYGYDWDQPMCLLRAGYGIKDYEVCNKLNLPEEPRMADPIESCKVGVGLALKDPSVCEKLKNKDDCFTRMATELKDPALCNNIQDAMFKGGCYSAAGLSKLDYNVCENMQTDSIDNLNCFISILGRFPDIEICNKYDRLRNVFCYRTVAAATKDEDICYKIKDLDEYVKIQKTIQEKPNTGGYEGLRNFLSYDVIGKCISDVAEKSGNVKMCDKIDNIAGRDYCIKNTNELIKKLDTCNTIDNVDLKNECRDVLTKMNLG